MKRGVRRLEGQPAQERFVGRAGVVLLEPPYHSLGVVVGDKVVCRVSVHLRKLVAFHHALRLEVAGLSGQKTIEAIKTTLQRPGAAVTRRMGIAVIGVVPFAHRHGGIALAT